MRIVYALLLLTSLLPSLASAQACPGANGYVGASAYVYGSSATGAAFIGTGCTAVIIPSTGHSQAPINCGGQAITGFHSFLAEWVSAGARVAAGTMGGCRFNCAGTTGATTCFVDGANGLPVELMEFSVE